MTNLVQNVSGEELGYAGMTIPADTHIEVEDAVAEAMVAGNPTKFALLYLPTAGDDEASEAPSSPENRAVDTRGQVCSVHGNRHYYNAQNTCRCGYVNVKQE